MYFGNACSSNIANTKREGDHKGDRSVCILISWRELNGICQGGNENQY